MAGIERRIENLEQALAPARPVVFYQEDRVTPNWGKFRRHGGDGRLLPASEIAADAGPNTTSIVIVYVDAPPRVDAFDANVIMLPDNGRGDQ